MIKFLTENKDYIYRVLISLVSMVVLSVLVFWTIYDFEVRFDYMSNSLFIVNMISFVIALVMQTGATRIYIGFTYSFKSLMKPKQTSEEYPSMQDYYDERAPKHKKNVSYLLFVNVFLLIVAYVLSIL